MPWKLFLVLNPFLVLTGRQIQDKNKATDQRADGMESMGAKKDLARLLAIEDNWTNSKKRRWLEKPPQGKYSWNERETWGEEAELILYTDRACNNNGAGYEFAAIESNRLCHSEKGLLGRSCPYEAELYAVRAGTKPTEVKRHCNIMHRFKVSRTPQKTKALLHYWWWTWW